MCRDDVRFLKRCYSTLALIHSPWCFLYRAFVARSTLTPLYCPKRHLRAPYFLILQKQHLNVRSIILHENKVRPHLISACNLLVHSMWQPRYDRANQFKVLSPYHLLDRDQQWERTVKLASHTYFWNTPKFRHLQPITLVPWNSHDLQNWGWVVRLREV